MSKTRLTLISGLGMLVIYSAIMVATGGTVATNAWLILVVGIALVVTAGRLDAAEKADRHDG